jgi:hypothetical protein
MQGANGIEELTISAFNKRFRGSRGPCKQARDERLQRSPPSHPADSPIGVRRETLSLLGCLCVLRGKP